eukprot:TRINITY_DN34220_c0_g2_i1.p1 TRINITY_DN34220_c0_g2~~TRINITY_DN34220_c0_g2_i1.p1  ORF type:complete len:283 (+),score=56.56 TRINITY_DN34220_c0_g2_i1:237-1085(+)
MDKEIRNDSKKRKRDSQTSDGEDEDEEISTLSAALTARRVAISWTGGKDSTLTLHRMAADSKNVVVALVVFHPPDPAFRAHPISMMELQAKALGLPLLRKIILADKFEGDYRRAYAACIRELREEHDIEAIATGDMDLVGDMTRNFVEECCEMAQCNPPMKCLLPLWHANRDHVLQELQALGIRCCFTCVKAPWFDQSWIGRELDEAAIAQMRLISADPQLDMCGENGEFHTCAIDGPLYKAVIAWDLGQAVAEELKGAEGQGSRWWVIKDLSTIGTHLRWK